MCLFAFECKARAEHKPMTENEFKDILSVMRGHTYEAVGRGITQWANTESLLILIGASLLGTSFEKSGVVFYSIINFNVWLSIISELMPKTAEYEKAKEKWGSLSEKLRRLNNTRVLIAHHPVDTDYPIVRPHDLNTTLKAIKSKPLDTSEILAWVEDVVKTSNELISYTKYLYALCKQQEKCS